MSPTALSECLRLRLLDDGRTHGQLALRTGIPRKTLSDWLAQSHRPSADTIDKAFRFLVAEGWDPLACDQEKAA